MKLFISQPMRGKTDEEILTERERAVAVVKEKIGDDVEVIDSFFEGAPRDAKPSWFLKRSLPLLSTADVAYFAGDWMNYKGCKIEHGYAVVHDITIIEE